VRFAVLLLVVFAAAPRAQPAEAAPRSAGYVESGGRLVYFEVVQGGEVVIGEGAEGRPRVRVPYAAFVDVLSRAARDGALVPDSVESTGVPLALDVDDRSVVRLATEVPAGQLALGLLGVTLIGIVAAGVVWDRRARRAARLRRTFRHRLAAAREAERAHVARELHDGPVQDLCAVQMALGGAAGGSEASRVAVAGVVGELRALCDRLRPAALDAFGLPAALAALADRAARPPESGGRGLDVRYAATGPAEAVAEALSDDRRLALYRIAQEALANAVQHARATRVDVALRLDGETLTLAVDDDGVGLPGGEPMDFAARGHFGLLGMHERADLLRATLTAGPGPLGGTRVALDIPVPALVSPTPLDA
jgi:signal transduction histidine kinase